MPMSWISLEYDLWRDRFLAVVASLMSSVQRITKGGWLFSTKKGMHSPDGRGKEAIRYMTLTHKGYLST